MDPNDALPQWLPEQRTRLADSDCRRIVDVHCHCLPGLDDGPDSLEDSMRLLSALARDGFTTIVATPHQLGPYDRRNPAGRVRELIDEVAYEAACRGIPIELRPGADVRIDERLLDLLDAGELLTVADQGRHLLLELPHEQFLDPSPLFLPLAERGVQTVMTHPERHRYLRRNLSTVERWVDQGALIQVTAGSLVGDFGEGAYNAAWELVGWGLCHVVATDAHDDQRRPPRMNAAITALREQAPEWAVQRMVHENPHHMLVGDWVTAGQIREDGS
ncbi:Tyrosine-protein phosphatase YwqE [Posidoniimonas corsicana]|uniref:protein-tyrosine-phosphatase n=1 Tax=Posidoniimonas corsicana TaxID=1938618 RepID=A0A5C5VH81_9BACT|nr:CpsB/CapC family capsule biosynthesis tyrosine phosphatase [Posidoniimonas corsicana]TWT37085.1 Tyrosine-protein phosphatase YwqE [Posidoniimonas corsicana]